jgi:hypothetical protein
MKNRDVLWMAGSLCALALVFGCPSGSRRQGIDQEELRRSMASGSPEVTFRVGKAEFVLRRILPGEFHL